MNSGDPGAGSRLRLPERTAEELLAFLRAGSDTDGLVPLGVVRKAAARFSLSFSETEKFLLENHLFPLRYQRQRALFGARGQLALLRSRVGLVGCGGLGGALFEMLVRLGVGRLVVIDPDVFSETNLNRQLLATVANLACSKVEAARKRAAELNPAVEVTALARPFQDAAAASLLAGCSLVFDGLDSVAARRELALLCADLEASLVHGAVDAWCGQVAVIPPGGGLEFLYPADDSVNDSFNDPVSGLQSNLSPTVNAIAALQVAAGLRLLLEGLELPAETRVGAFLDLLVPELESWS